MSRWIALLAALALLAAACDLASDTETTPPAAPETPSPVTTTTAAEDAVVLTDVSPLVTQVRAGVVAITIRAITLDQFLQPTLQEGAGSGFVLDDQGHIVTNAHVVRGAEEITVFSPDGTRRSARVVGIRPERDLALLKTDDTSGLQPLPLGSSEELEVGDPVVAIGNALGFGPSPTVSVGIVSAKDRVLPTREGVNLQGLIQTDAAINPGNSGGPLLDGRGRVVGINTAIIRGAQNIGFAISIDSARSTLDAFLTRAGEPFLGVLVVPNNPQLARQVGLSVDTGAVVVEVQTGTPADQAGLQPGDVIVGADGSEVADAQDLLDTIDAHQPGDTLSLEVVRGDRRMSVEATLAER